MAASCTALTKEGRRCLAPAELVIDGLCPVHAGRVDAATIGRAGGVASGAARREQARRVRERVEESRVHAALEQAKQKRRALEADVRASRQRYYRQFVERRNQLIAEGRAELSEKLRAERAELSEKLRAERAELRRLRKQRKRLETAA